MNSFANNLMRIVMFFVYAVLCWVLTFVACGEELSAEDAVLPESLILSLYEEYRRALDDQSEAPTRRVFSNNKQYSVHVEKLKEVNGVKPHNVEVKGSLRNGIDLFYITNPVEAKVSKAYLSVDEFKLLLENNAYERRQTKVLISKPLTKPSKAPRLFPHRYVVKETRATTRKVYIAYVPISRAKEKYNIPPTIHAPVKIIAKDISVNKAPSHTAKITKTTRKETEPTTIKKVEKISTTLHTTENNEKTLHETTTFNTTDNMIETTPVLLETIGETVAEEINTNVPEITARSRRTSAELIIDSDDDDNVTESAHTKEDTNDSETDTVKVIEISGKTNIETTLAQISEETTARSRPPSAELMIDTDDDDDDVTEATNIEDSSDSTVATNENNSEEEEEETTTTTITKATRATLGRPRVFMGG